MKYLEYEREWNIKDEFNQVSQFDRGIDDPLSEV